MHEKNGNIYTERQENSTYKGKVFHGLNVGQMASQVRVVWDVGQFIWKRDYPTQSGTVGQLDSMCVDSTS